MSLWAVVWPDGSMATGTEAEMRIVCEEDPGDLARLVEGTWRIIS